MEISALFLARAQFALSLNMRTFCSRRLPWRWAGFLCVFRFRAWQAPESGWTAAYRFWVRIFALVVFFGVGDGFARAD